MKVVFYDEPSLSPFGDGDTWVLNEPFIVGLTYNDLVIPEGFVTDLASVPHWLPLSRSLLAGKARRSAIVHDYLYATQAGKELADSVFLAAMKAEKVSAPVRWMFYTAVSLFGQAIYDRKAHENSAGYSDIG